MTKDTRKARVKPSPGTREKTYRQEPGRNPNVPVKTWDLRPNRQRFEIGDKVTPLDPSEPPITGEVVGYAGRDRVYVQWPYNLDQEDIDDLMDLRTEWTLGASSLGHDITNMARMKGYRDDLRRASRMSDPLKKHRRAGIKVLNGIRNLPNFPAKQASALKRVCLVASGTDVLYSHRGTRKASADRTAGAAIRNAIRSALAVADSLRGTHPRTAARIEVATLNAFAYPTSK